MYSDKMATYNFSIANFTVRYIYLEYTNILKMTKVCKQ